MDSGGRWRLRGSRSPRTSTAASASMPRRGNRAEPGGTPGRLATAPAVPFAAALSPGCDGSFPVALVAAAGDAASCSAFGVASSPARASRSATLKRPSSRCGAFVTCAPCAGGGISRGDIREVMMRFLVLRRRGPCNFMPPNRRAIKRSSRPSNARARDLFGISHFAYARFRSGGCFVRNKSQEISSMTPTKFPCVQIRITIIIASRSRPFGHRPAFGRPCESCNPSRSRCSRPGGPVPAARMPASRERGSSRGRFGRRDPARPRTLAALIPPLPGRD